MIHRFVIENVHDPKDSMKISKFENQVTLLEIGEEFHEREFIAIAYISGKKYFPLHSEWHDTTLNDGDCVYFMPRVGDPISIIIAVVVVVAITIALNSIVDPPNVGDQPQADPVFSLAGQRNAVKLGDVIEDAYGKNRLYPSYGARGYNQFYGNDDFQYQLFCLGHGSVDIERIQIEDTPIDNFQEVEFEVYQPFETVTLFPDNVETSSEVSNIELLATNEDNYEGITGPLTANATNTNATALEVDVTLPNGLSFSNDDGGLSSLTIRALFEYREHGSDDEWQVLAEFERTLRTVTPQRYTLRRVVPQGRYEVRGQRLDTKNTSARARHTIQWTRMRAFLQTVGNYGDVTMLAVRSRATNNLNDNSSNRINVIATRKLPIYNPTTKTIADIGDVGARVATRSPIWAMVNILRAKYGGNLVDQFIDYEYINQIAEEFESDNILFDWVYDQKSTVWQAVKMPCFVGKAVPILNGSQVTVSVDKPQPHATFFISPENTVENSFRLNKKLFQVNENDGLQVEYVDPETYLKETVTCLLDDSPGVNLKTVSLFGVSDRQRAFDLGMYLWFKERKERDQVSLTTGLEGYIANYNDLVQTSSDIPKWGVTGYVESIQGAVMELSREVSFDTPRQFRIGFRGIQGQNLGPFPCSPFFDDDGNIDKNKVVLDAAIEPTQFCFDDQIERPYFMFGESDNAGRICRITNLTPNDDDTVALQMVVDDQRRFSDFGPAPAFDASPLPPAIPSAPSVGDLIVQPVLNSLNFITVTWQPALGANNYVVESSLDGVNYTQEEITMSNSSTLAIERGMIYVRVAGVGSIQGAFSEFSGIVGQPTSNPLNVQNLRVDPAFTGNQACIKWDALQSADNYFLTISTLEAGGSEYIERYSQEVNATEFTLTREFAIENAIEGRSFKIDVVGRNELGDSPTPSSVIATNNPPATLTGLNSVLTSESASDRFYDISWNVSTATDISRYRVWGSSQNGFTPDDSNIIFDGLASGASIAVSDDGGGFETVYWRVAAVDVWGDEVNFSEQASF